MFGFLKKKKKEDFLDEDIIFDELNEDNEFDEDTEFDTISSIDDEAELDLSDSGYNNQDAYNPEEMIIEIDKIKQNKGISDNNSDKKIKKKLEKAKNKQAKLVAKKKSYTRNVVEDIINKNYQYVDLDDEEIDNKAKEIPHYAGELRIGLDEFFFIPSIQKKVLHSIYGTDITIIETIEELETKYDISDYYIMEEKSPVRYKQLKDMKAIVGINKQTTKKAIGMFYPTIEISNMLFEEIFFLSPELVSFFYTNKDIDFISSDDNKNKLDQLLNYMEYNKVSDLHFFLFNDFYYTFTARRNSAVESISKNKIRKNLVEDLVRESIVACGQDVYTKKPEIRGLIKRTIINEGLKTERNFRLHLIESSTGNEIGKSVSIRKLMNFEELNKLGFEGLGYSKKAVKLIKEAVELYHNGVSMISGPTNSGKSTMLYTLLLHMLHKGKRIHTIEAPIEIVIPGLIQIDLKNTENAKEELKLTMVKAMKALLSQDPDITLINEVRDAEEINSLMNLALQGHMAFSTLHANNVETTIKRLNKSAPMEDIIASVRLIVNQELIAKKCKDCNGEGEIDGKVCKVCNGSKISGRLPIYEVALFKGLEDSDNIYDFQELIKKGKLSYISKKEIAEDYHKQGVIRDDDYIRILHDT